MARPRFSQMLLDRRHELGLSLQQASRILKLREDVLQAFEEGDYQTMPQSGYAQGMLSSYARYLGLNARAVVDLFQEELYEHKTGSSSHELRRRTRDTQAGRGVSGYEVPNESGSRPRAYVQYRPLLPTGGGPAGDMGNFATTAPARPRTSVPLAGAGTPAAGTRSAHASSAFGTRSYNVSMGTEGEVVSRRRPAALQRRKNAGVAGRSVSESADPSMYRRDDVSTRRVRAGEYIDDMRYDDEASAYAPASTLSGRRSSRNIANLERPRVRRRSEASGSSTRSSRTAAQRNASPAAVLMGSLMQFLSDPRRAMLVMVLAVGLVLSLILLFSIQSCMSSKTIPSETEAVPVGTVTPTTTTTTTTNTGGDAAATNQKTDDSSAAAGTDSAAPAQPQETKVTVEVAAGKVTWLEITNDGKSEIAESVTGPWTATYTVHDSITVQAGEPDAVTVTENGKKKNFNSRASGVGTLNIKGTPAPDPAAEGQNQADGTSGQQSQSQTSNTSTSSQSGAHQTGQGGGSASRASGQDHSSRSQNR